MGGDQFGNDLFFKQGCLVLSESVIVPNLLLCPNFLT